MIIIEKLKMNIELINLSLPILEKLSRSDLSNKFDGKKIGKVIDNNLEFINKYLKLTEIGAIGVFFHDKRYQKTLIDGKSVLIYPEKWCSSIRYQDYVKDDRFVKSLFDESLLNLIQTLKIEEKKYKELLKTIYTTTKELHFLIDELENIKEKILEYPIELVNVIINTKNWSKIC